MKRILTLAPNVFFLGLVSLFNDFSAEMIIAVMPAFLISLGATPIFIGLLEGFADALASVLKIISGWYSDKIRRRKIISVSGYSLSVFTRWILFFAASPWHVFLLRATDRIGKGLRDSPRDALLAESVEKPELGKSFGYQRAMDAVGGIFGPLVAVILLPLLMGDYRKLFVIAFGVGILGILSFIPVREKPKELQSVTNYPRALSFSLKNFNAPFKLFLISVFIFGLGAMPVSLIALKSLALGDIVVYLPLMYLIYSISFAVFAIPFGKISDVFGERLVISGGFLLAALSYLILAKADNFLAIATGFIVFGLYSAMTNGVQRAFASKLIASDLQASGQGFLGAATGLSSLLAGLVGGYIWTVFGATPAFYYGAVMMAIGLLTFISLNGFKKELY